MDNTHKISSEQIEQLYAFTRKHFVEYYDLQTELVDHMANAIEDRWQEDPKLSFDEVLKQEFKKFGIFGFMGVVEQRQLALTKKYNKLIWSNFRTFFKLPKVMLTIAMVGAFYQSFKISSIIFGVLFIAAFLALFVRAVYFGIRLKRKAKRTGKRWMLEEIIFRCGGFGPMIYLPYQLTRFLFNDSYAVLGQLLLAIAFTAFLLYEYIILFVIPAEAQKHLTATYPEYALENCK